MPEGITEVKLDPIGNKPISSAFDPKIFEQAKERGTTAPPPIPDFTPAKESTLGKDEANFIADEMIKGQKENEELLKKEEEEAKKKETKVEKEEEKEVEEEEEKEIEEETKPKLKPLKLEKKEIKKSLTEEEELAKFDEESLPFAKKMDRSARQWVLSQLSKKDKVIEETKKNVSPARKEGELPDSYYLHDKAYLLDPQYDQSLNIVNQVQRELAYWEQQFAKVRTGEKEWDDVVVGANGQLVQIKRESNAASESDLIKRINHANTLVQQHTGMLNYLATNYKTKVADAMTKVKSVEDEFFPQFSEEKNLKSHKFFEPVNTLLAAKGMSQLVPASLFQKLFLHAQDQQEYIEELEAAQGKENIDDKIKKNPGSKDFKGGEGGKKKSGEEDGFDFGAFEKAKKSRGY